MAKEVLLSLVSSFIPQHSLHAIYALAPLWPLFSPSDLQCSLLTKDFTRVVSSVSFSPFLSSSSSRFPFQRDFKEAFPNFLIRSMNDPTANSHGTCALQLSFVSLNKCGLLICCIRSFIIPMTGVVCFHSHPLWYSSNCTSLRSIPEQFWG